MSEERKREIRQGELARAVHDLAEALGISEAGLSERVGWVFWEFAAIQRRTWASRDFEQLMRETWADLEDNREKKLKRLIEHPATPPQERNAAELALARIRGA